jgi:hypothetical protein
MVNKAEHIGVKVLAGLEKARRIWNAERRLSALQTQERVLHWRNLFLEHGYPVRGLAGRISRKMGGHPSERHVKRILDTLSAMSDCLCDHAAKTG